MSLSSQRVVLTGFMGVGKTSVAKHLSYLLRIKTLDLDWFIANREGVSIPEIISTNGEEFFRDLETEYLSLAMKENAGIISLGGGVWTLERNRKIIAANGLMSVWLESTFDHCWRNIQSSRHERPLVNNKVKAKRLFDERVKFYCLADWHFIVQPGSNSYDVARQIAAEVFA